MDEFDRESAYRFYVARSLQLAPQSSWLTIPYWEFIENNGESETQSGDEIVANIMEKAGLTFGE